MKLETLTRDTLHEERAFRLCRDEPLMNHAGEQMGAVHGAVSVGVPIAYEVGLTEIDDDQDYSIVSIRLVGGRVRHAARQGNSMRLFF